MEIWDDGRSRSESPLERREAAVWSRVFGREGDVELDVGVVLTIVYFPLIEEAVSSG